LERHEDQLLQAIVVEYDSYRKEFQTLFTLEDDFAMDDYPEFDEEEEDYWNTYHDIVPLVYFAK
jgi:hypothetical protein